MSVQSIHPRTEIGAVALTVPDLARALRFYRDIMGLDVTEHDGEGVSLTAGDAMPLVLLRQERGAKHPPRRTTGLYHFALLVPSRIELARVLRRLAEARWPFQGFSDHGVSEAIYLADVDGIGIEIYRDRPRREWPLRNGQLQMVTEPLDVNSLLAELSLDDHPWTGLHPQTRMGHVHLHVANLREAEAFYCGILGFDLVQRYGESALFVSAGGYHHHIGLNTWAGVGAPPPPPDSIGLRYITIRLPDEAERGRIAKELQSAGVTTQETPEGLAVRDPSGNGIRLVVGPGESN